MLTAMHNYILAHTLPGEPDLLHSMWINLHGYIVAHPLESGAVVFYPLVFALALVLAQMGRLLTALVVAGVLFLSATLALDFLQADVSSKEKKVIVVASMWASGESKQPIFEDVIREFEEKYKGYRVKIKWEGRSVVSTNRPRLLTHKDVPDIIEGSGEELRILVQEQYALPMDQYMEEPSPETGKPWRDDWIPSLYELGRYHLKPITVDGKKVPHPLENKLMLVSGIDYEQLYFYNKAIARRLDLKLPVHTWSEFKAACQKAADAGIQPIKLDEGYSGSFADSVMQASLPPGELRKTILGLAGSKPFTDPMYERIFALDRELLDKYTMKGWQGSQWPGAQSAFANGQGLFIACGSWLAGELKKVEVHDPSIFELGCMPLPHFDDEPHGWMVIAPSGWLVLKDGNETAGARLLLQFMSNHHWGRAIALKDGNPVAFKGDPIPPRLNDVREELTEMKYPIYDPITAYAAKWQNYIYLQLHDDYIKAEVGTSKYMTTAEFLAKLEADTARYRAQGGESKWD
jgi:ABC-type glycerol-3-phosphate transport system substrate-binding protein